MTDVRSDATPGEVQLFEQALRSATDGRVHPRAKAAPADLAEASACRTHDLR
ncbi:hypothetical protein GS421_11580 [Rhodococcus hoagii]|nr:hypothetical protein [Prescottella equi]